MTDFNATLEYRTWGLDDGRLGKNSNIVTRMEGRNRNIDGLKGFLIVMVILGHVLQGKILDNFGRYVIYS